MADVSESQSAPLPVHSGTSNSETSAAEGCDARQQVVPQHRKRLEVLTQNIHKIQKTQQIHQQEHGPGRPLRTPQRQRKQQPSSAEEAAKASLGWLASLAPQIIAGARGALGVDDNVPEQHSAATSAQTHIRPARSSSASAPTVEVNTPAAQVAAAGMVSGAREVLGISAQPANGLLPAQSCSARPRNSTDQRVGGLLAMLSSSSSRKKLAAAGDREKVSPLRSALRARGGASISIEGGSSLAGMATLSKKTSEPSLREALFSQVIEPQKLTKSSCSSFPSNVVRCMDEGAALRTFARAPFPGHQVSQEDLTIEVDPVGATDRSDDAVLAEPAGEPQDAEVGLFDMQVVDAETPLSTFEAPPDLIISHVVMQQVASAEALQVEEEIPTVSLDGHEVLDCEAKVIASKHGTVATGRSLASDDEPEPECQTPGDKGRRFSSHDSSPPTRKSVGSIADLQEFWGGRHNGSFVSGPLVVTGNEKHSLTVNEAQVQLQRLLASSNADLDEVRRLRRQIDELQCDSDPLLSERSLRFGTRLPRNSVA